MKYNENKWEYLKIIQNVINRMASNSFIIKGWAITFLGALLTLLASESLKINRLSLLIVIIGVIILFWGCDAYYLNLERGFRKLYNEVITKDESEIDYEMIIKKENLFRIAFRPILISLYGSIALIAVILFLINKMR